MARSQFQLVASRVTAVSCLCAVVLFVLIAVVRNAAIVSSLDSQVDFQSAKPLPLIPHAKNVSRIEGGAYVFLGLGAQANQMNCPAAIESLVRVAGWDGPVYLITDRKNCFDHAEIAGFAGMKKDNLRLVYTDETFGDIGIDIWNPTIGTRKNRIKSFTMKTRLFDFVTDPSVHTIAYADCDVLFGREGCATEFMASPPSFDSHAIKFTRVDYPGDLPSGDAPARATTAAAPTPETVLNVHAGTFVAHRNASKHAMREWRMALESGQYEHDRDAFMHVYRQGRAAGASLPAQAYTPGMATLANAQGLPATARDPAVRVESFLDSPLGVPYCINHISKTRCAALGRDPVQKFVDRFQLRSYGGRYRYCPDERLLPLLYGWFPVSYLPYCPKVETML